MRDDTMLATDTAIRRAEEDAPLLSDPVPVVVVGDPGRAFTEIGAGRPTQPWGRPDVAASACELPGITARCASVRGVLHRAHGTGRQDAFAVAPSCDSAGLVAVVADGVGSLGRSAEAADVAVELVAEAIADGGDWLDAIRTANRALADRAAARLTGDVGTDPAADGMATTVIGVHITESDDGWRLSLGWVGDSEVWHLDGGTWTLLSEADRSEEPFHTGGVSALPHADPAISTRITSVTGGVVLVMTDGVGVPLRSEAVQDALGRMWGQPPDLLTFVSQVSFGRKSHMDDRTVVGIWLGSRDGEAQV